MANGNRGQQPPQRPSRDTLVRNYNAKDASRARNARMYSQEAMQSFKEREERTRERNMQRQAFAEQSRREHEQRASRGQSLSTNYMTQAEAQERARSIRAQGRVRKPLTTQESHDITQMSREAYEQERARRDVLNTGRHSRTSNREVIDGRGSIDSRAFNEKNELVGYSIDVRDRPDPAVDSSGSQVRWTSHAGQGFAQQPTSRQRTRGKDLDSLSDTISGRSDYQSAGGFLSTVPGSVKFLAVLIVVLLIVLIVLLFF